MKYFAQDIEYEFHIHFWPKIWMIGVILDFEDGLFFCIGIGPFNFALIGNKK